MRYFESFNGFWELLGAITGVSAVFFAAIRVSMMNMLRQSNEDLRERVKEMDEETVRCRDEIRDMGTRIDEMTRHLAVAENKITTQGALLYDKQRYIGRLERGYREMGRQLPPRDRLGGELKEQE